MNRTAYISRKRIAGGDWNLALIGFENGEVSTFYATCEVPDDSMLLALADEFLYGVAAAKDLDVKARRGNDE